MRLLLAAGAWLVMIFGLASARLSAQTAPASGRRLTLRQTQQIARLVARHDRIDLTDTHIELNSMDLGSDFIPGYSSFIVIRESSTPGPDETLRRYAVNRRTGDVWEMTLCTHYDFPELTRLRRALALRNTPGAGDIASEGKELGCTDQKTAPAS
jgi:hypothetical protein